MTTAVELPIPRQAWVAPAEKPLDEAVWAAWVAKGRTEELRSTALHLKAVKWASVAALIAAAALWSHLATYEVVLRFIVTAGSMVVMLQAFRTSHYAFAVLFGLLALLYNPVAPILGFSSDWQRAVVLASSLPFVASLAWRNRQAERLATASGTERARLENARFVNNSEFPS
ncbi:MAG: DUF6804 family protein [Bryobacteraceae bacterium]